MSCEKTEDDADDSDHLSPDEDGEIEKQYSSMHFPREYDKRKDDEREDAIFGGALGEYLKDKGWIKGRQPTRRAWFKEDVRDNYDQSVWGTKCTKGWFVEGAGVLKASVDEERGPCVEFKSPSSYGHHVLWTWELQRCFVATWEAKNMNIKSGLLMSFFATRGLRGESICDSKLQSRASGAFSCYRSGDLSMYGISYYRNTPRKPNRGSTHFRINPSLADKYKNAKGCIPSSSDQWHRISLMHVDGIVEFWIDDERIFSFNVNDEWEGKGGKPFMSGWLGFRQMKWTHFRYTDLRVWDWGGMETSRSVKPVSSPCAVC